MTLLSTPEKPANSILGSISRSIRIHSGPLDVTGYAIGPDSLRNDDRSVDPGDRYPTTGLTPPSAFNLEVRSFFSDNSSRSQRGGSFRKRLTHLKAKLPPVHVLIRHLRIVACRMEMGRRKTRGL